MQVTNFCHIFGRGNGDQLIRGTAYSRVYTVHHRAIPHDPSLSADQQCRSTMSVIILDFWWWMIATDGVIRRCQRLLALVPHGPSNNDRPCGTAHTVSSRHKVEWHRQFSLIAALSALFMFVTLWLAEFRYIFVVCLCLIFVLWISWCWSIQWFQEMQHVTCFNMLLLLLLWLSLSSRVPTDLENLQKPGKLLEFC